MDVPGNLRIVRTSRVVVVEKKEVDSWQRDQLAPVARGA